MNRVVPITTSQTESRIRGYRAAGDIELSEREIELIDKEGKRRQAWVYPPGLARFLGVTTVTYIMLRVIDKEDFFPIGVYWPGIVKFIGLLLVAFVLISLLERRSAVRAA